MKKFVSEAFKCAISGKPYADEASHAEGCVNPNIQENYNLTNKNISVDYPDMLLPIAKICRVKN